MIETTIENAIYIIDHLEMFVEDALSNEVAKTVKDAIQDEVMMGVYGAHEATPYFMKHRRGDDDGGGGIADKEQMDATAVGCELTITDNADLQNLFGPGSNGDWWSASVADIVEKGSKRFNQPGPRPFLNEAAQDAIVTGAVDDALKLGLQRQGIEVD